jgi:hypothetical protein
VTTPRESDLLRVRPRTVEPQFASFLIVPMIGAH